MNFTPKTEQQIKEDMLLPKDNYSFEVIEAVNKKSKKGNDMIELKVLIYPKNPEASPRQMNDYLMEKMMFKLKHFCDETGLQAKYTAGTLTSDDCVGKTGKCQIIIQEDETGQYGPKNSIRDYGAAKKQDIGGPIPEAGSSKKEEMAKDDIPF